MFSFLRNQSDPGQTLSTRSTLVQNFVFCTVVALVLWKFVPAIGSHGFWSSFVYSQLIGNSICLMTIGLAPVLNHYGANTQWVRLVCFLLIPVAGAIVGWSLATWLVYTVADGPDISISKRGLLVSAFIAITASYIFSHFLSRRQKQLQLELDASEQSRRADNARYAMLQAQLEPHMLFNTLANLRALIKTDPERALDMLDRLDNFLRTTLSSSQTPTHPLEHEFNVLDDYLALMQVRFGDRLRYTLDLPVDCQQHLVPSLVLQPLVENAIKHGIDPQVSGGEIHVTAQCSGTQTILTVMDTGVGYDLTPVLGNDPVTHKENSTDGFGLTSLQERLTQIHGTDAKLTIESTNSANSVDNPTGTTVTLSLPRVSEATCISINQA